jgi:hypothetical protein
VPVRCARFPLSIGVLIAPDLFMPIGMAPEAGRIDGDLVIRRLMVARADVSGRSVIVDRYFSPPNE